MLTSSTFSMLKPQLKLDPSKPTIENFVFRCHYRVTVVILLVFVGLVCWREYMGEHIRCITDQALPVAVIQTYCFFMATFTVVRHYNETLLQQGFLPHPGVGPILESDQTLHHTYYQWVPFVLFLQSICFYLPHYVWKKKEGGRVKALVDGLQLARLALEDEDMTVNKETVPSRSSIQKRIESIRKDIVLRLRVTRTWSTWLVAMEVTNLVHIIVEIYITDKLLNGYFLGLGPRVFAVEADMIADPLETVFPKVTKCIFHKYGAGGSIQQHDALCVMSLNIIHEKIYSMLWFWFLFLFIASVLAVVWRLMTFWLYRRSPRFNQVVFHQVSSGKFNSNNLNQVVNGCQFADWLFLYYLAKNMDGFVFQELFKRLAEELSVTDQLDHHDAVDTPASNDLVNFTDETLPLKNKSS